MAAAGGTQHPPQGAMLAVQAALAEIEELTAVSDPQVVLANRNSPGQGVLSGPTTAIIGIEKICQDRKIRAVRLPVSAAFHSEQIDTAVQPFLNALEKISIKPNAVDVFSNTTGRAYPADPQAVRRLLGEQLIRPVNFVDEIENFYDSGVRTFVEIGPKSVLSGLISATLQGRDFETAALDASAGKTYGIADLARLLGRLAALGYPVSLSKWESPPTSNRTTRLNIPLSGANYKNLKTEDRGQKTEDGIRNTEDRRQRTEDRKQMTEDRKPEPDDRRTFANQQNETMIKENNMQSGFIRDAYRVVAEGLKSMQNLQTQTAQAHQKFLEAQTEANRALQKILSAWQRNLSGFRPKRVRRIRF